MRRIKRGRPGRSITLSQDSYDTILDFSDNNNDLPFSRSIDTIIQQWKEDKKTIETFQQKATEDYQEIRELKAKIPKESD